MYLTELPISIQIPPPKVKIGDRVVITNPELVLRVGYPLSYEEAYRKTIELYGPQLKDFLKRTVYDADGEFQLDIDLEHRDVKRVLGGLARLYMAQAGYGGKERAIHTVSRPELQGQVFTVMNKRVCKTGTYDAPYGYTDHNGEYDYYPGVLLTVGRTFFWS